MTRLAPDAGFQLLLRSRLTVGKAIAALREALHGEALHLWCNGALLPSYYIANHLRIDIEYGADGRPQDASRVKICPAGPVGWAEPPEYYAFELDLEEVKAVIARLRTKRRKTRRKKRPEKNQPKPRRGHPVVYPWDQIDPVISDELKCGGQKVAARVRVKLQTQKIPIPSPRHLQARVRIMRGKSEGA
jgi:hypothetical protein